MPTALRHSATYTLTANSFEEIAATMIKFFMPLVYISAPCPCLWVLRLVSLLCFRVPECCGHDFFSALLCECTTSSHWLQFPIIFPVLSATFLLEICMSNACIFN